MGGLPSGAAHQAGLVTESSSKNLGCDNKGTVLCKDSELTCINGGICALYVSEDGTKCVERCKCPRDYFGNYCQFEASFYSATIGLVIGLFIALLFIVFIAICIWYCCNQRKRRIENMRQGDRLPTRTCLSNRLENESKMLGSQLAKHTVYSDETNRINSSSYGERTNLDLPHMQKYSTSQSFSAYENVGCGEDDSEYVESIVELVRPVHNGPTGSRETTYLLGFDRTDGYHNLKNSSKPDDQNIEIDLGTQNSTAYMTIHPQNQHQSSNLRKNSHLTEMRT